MIYFCADDYGLCEEASWHIKKCADSGVINKISVFPNMDKVDLNEIIGKKNIRISLHLNLVEGKCMADATEVKLLADKNGSFRHTFGGLLKLNLFYRNKFEAEVYKEIQAQVLFWKSILPDNTSFCIDSHQHTHMIPTVFKALLKVLRDEKICPEYIRIPAEPILPYIKVPSLYFTYSPVNIIKQMLLKFLWMTNRKFLKKFPIKTALFFGILFSGRMDDRRVSRVLTEYKKLAEKNGNDIEVLLHPGYLQNNPEALKNKDIAFEKFYLSKNRRTEFDTIMSIKERSVH